MVDLTDAYIRDSGASLAFAADGKYYRPFLPTGMVGHFRQGAVTINRAREAMKAGAEESARLEGEVSGLVGEDSGLVGVAARGDMSGRLPPDGRSGFLRQIGIAHVLKSVPHAHLVYCLLLEQIK